MPPQDPIGYPFIAISDCFADDAMPQSMDLRQGDEGKILLAWEERLFVSKVTMDGPVKGWVPRTAVEIGSVKYEDNATGHISLSSSTRLPIVEQYPIEITWTKYTIKDVAEIYRGPTREVTCEGSTNLVWAQRKYNHGKDGTSDSSNNYLRFTLAHDEPGPKPGDDIIFVCEISLNDEPHPERYARLPDFGPWSDWEKACSVAIRIEWFPENQRCTRYLEVGDDGLMDENVPGSIRSYANAMGLYHYFKQQTVADRPHWLTDLGIAHVREERYNKVTNKVYYKEHRPKETLLPAATLRSDGAWLLDLTRAGAFRVGGSFGTAPGIERNICDVHLMLQSRGDWIADAKCEQFGSTDRCKLCWAWARPCTWTPPEILFRDPARAEKLQNALFWRGKLDNEITFVGEPKFKDGMLALTDSEPDDG